MSFLIVKIFMNFSFVVNILNWIFLCSFSVAGSHITLVAHSRSVQIALEAAKELEAEGIDCEV